MSTVKNMPGKIADLAVRLGAWWLFLAGFLAVFIVPAIIGNTSPWLWLLAALGLIMTAIHPAGTSLRYRRLVRQANRLERERVTATATLAVYTVILDRVSRLQQRIRGRARNGRETGQ
jgi:hypothetical protein